MLRASEKKRKREERPPEPRGIPRRSEAQPQRKREEVAPGDAMEDNVDQEVQMPGPLRPSKREIREKENYNAIGGMRNPMRTLERLTKVREFGMKMVHWWVTFVQKYPEAMVTAQLYGSPVCKPLDAVTDAWRKVLRERMEVEETKQDLVMKENWEFV